MSLFEAANEIQPDLARITCPLLLFTSPEDHVVPPADSDYLAAQGVRPGRAGQLRPQLPRRDASTTTAT